ncbi:MAG: YfhO family protein [Acidobacteria bacterium]|nr:YfhO family protein [Acidobacteriota bacterium]
MTTSSGRWPVGGLALLVAALFSDALAGGGVFFQRDIHWVWYPGVETVVRAVAEGAWPLWNPHVTFGLPALADPSYQLCYPPTWLNLVLPPGVYYKVFVLGHSLGAGLGLFVLARRWRLSPAAAFLAAAVWVTSGPVLSCVSLYHHFAGLSWMPWVLLALDRALGAGGLGASVGLGAVASGQVLAGSGDMCLMTAVMGLAHAVLVVREAPSGRAALLARFARTGLVAAAVASTLSAVQWMPTLSILAEGSRLKLQPSANLYWSLHPASLADALVPGLLSDLPASRELRGVLFESREPLVASLYLGMGACAFVLLAVLLGRDRTRLFALGCGGLFLVCALGRYTPVYPLLLEVPPLSILRYPAKYIFPFSLCWALLAGAGLDAWLASWERREERRATLAGGVMVGLGALALLAGEWGRRGGRGLLAPDASFDPTVAKLRLAAAIAAGLGGLLLWRGSRQARAALAPVLTLVAITDLMAVGREVNGLAPPALATHRPSWTRDLTSGGPHRLYVVPFASAARDTLKPTPAGWSLEWWWTLGMQDAVAPPISARWGIDGSYDGDFTGLGSPAVAFLSQVLAGARQPVSLRLLQLGGVDQVVSLEPLEGLGPPVREIASVFEGPIRVYRVPDTLPRVYVVGSSRVVEDAVRLRFLLGPEFDPHREVVLEEGFARPGAPSFSGQARLLWRRADALAVEVDTNGSGHLVVLDAHYPGWRAAVDGAPVPILRANALFRAVPVPAGRHLVEMRYRPGSVIWGALTAAVGSAIGLLALMAARRRRRAG